MSALTAVAMSGGLDSSVVAWMLAQDAATPVVGLSMLLWDHSTEAVHGRCCGALDLGDARRVAQQAGIPHYTLRLDREFRQTVVDPFVDDYLAGRTPSPCVRCNTWVKFDLLLERARRFGAERVATGHYARLVDGPAGRELHAAAVPDKDQSYFLFELTQEQLRASLFPLGDLSKDRVRELAREAGLVVAEKGESMEICFVSDGVRPFVERELERRAAAAVDAGSGAGSSGGSGGGVGGNGNGSSSGSGGLVTIGGGRRPGASSAGGGGAGGAAKAGTRDLAGAGASSVATLAPPAVREVADEPALLVDRRGRELGQGRAPYYRYTVGQRRGLGLSSSGLAGHDGRLYVLEIDAAANRVVVGGEDELACPAFVGERLHWINPDLDLSADDVPTHGVEATVKIRSRHPGVPCRVHPLPGGRARIELADPQRGVAPGQAAVLYRGTRVLGGCWIERGLS